MMGFFVLFTVSMCSDSIFNLLKRVTEGSLWFLYKTFFLPFVNLGAQIWCPPNIGIPTSNQLQISPCPIFGESLDQTVTHFICFNLKKVKLIHLLFHQLSLWGIPADLQHQDVIEVFFCLLGLLDLHMKESFIVHCLFHFYQPNLLSDELTFTTSWNKILLLTLLQEQHLDFKGCPQRIPKPTSTQNLFSRFQSRSWFQYFM